MRRVWILALYCMSLWLVLSPVMAQSQPRKTVFPESRRYSIEIPEDWYYESTTDPDFFFVGESLQIADSKETLDGYRETNGVDGQLILLDFIPLSTLALFGWRVEGVSERELLMNALFNEYADYEVTFSKIAGYPAATVDETGRSGGVFGGFVFRSVIWAGDTIFYLLTVARGESQVLAIDRLLSTFKVYPDDSDHYATDFSLRPPLHIENGALSVPLRQGWLVMTRELSNSPFNLRQLPLPERGDTSPQPYYHLIFWDKPLEFMRRVDAAYMDGGRIADRNLIGGMMQVGVYPYAWFTHNPESETTLQTLFSTIGGRAESYDISTTPHYTITGRLNSVFDAPDNVGRFMLIANGEHVFLVIIASPSVLWGNYAPLAESILERTVIVS